MLVYRVDVLSCPRMTGQGSVVRGGPWLFSAQGSRLLRFEKTVYLRRWPPPKTVPTDRKSLITRKAPPSGGGLGSRVSAGEQTYTLSGLADVILAGVRMVQPDIVKMGGITGLMRCAALAQAHGVKLVRPGWGYGSTTRNSPSAACRSLESLCTVPPPFTYSSRWRKPGPMVPLLQASQPVAKPRPR